MTTPSAPEAASAPGLPVAAPARGAHDPALGPRLEVGIYEVTDAGSFIQNRTDGSGWDWSWAEPRRDWMDRTTQRFAYRCLPLTIVNQTGLWVRNPIGFTALWREDDPTRVDFAFDGGNESWRSWITNHFGNGIITWNSPFLFRTRPSGSRILVMGPPNSFKENCQPLTGLVETDWASMTFTMNWKIVAPGRPVRFERGEPVFHVIPLARNPCLDLENAEVTLRRIDDDPAVAQSYREWFAGRNRFHELQKKGEIPAGEWQKHYFRGVTLGGTEAPTEHYTRINAPRVKDERGKAVAGAAPAAAGGGGGDLPVTRLVTAPLEDVDKRLFATSRPSPAPPLQHPAMTSIPAGGGAPGAAPRDGAGGAPSTSTSTAGAASSGDRTAGAAAARAGAEPPATFSGAFAPPAEGLRLRAYAVHPRAARVAPAEARGRRMGFHVHAPLDLDAVWYGGSSFDWKLLSPFGDEDAAVLAALAAKAGLPAPAGPARKLEWGAGGEGVLTLWTGLLLETPPGWCVEVRPAQGADLSPVLAAEPEVLETDAAPRELVLRLKFRATDRWARLRSPSGIEPGAARPIAHLLPLRRESFEGEWLAASVPIEAARGAAEVLRRFHASRP
jgi:hypothetical protein